MHKYILSIFAWLRYDCEEKFDVLFHYNSLLQVFTNDRPEVFTGEPFKNLWQLFIYWSMTVVLLQVYII